MISLNQSNEPQTVLTQPLATQNGTGIATSVEPATHAAAGSVTPLVLQLADIAHLHGLLPVMLETLADGTVYIRFGTCDFDFDRYISATIDDEGADIDIGGLIGDCRASIRIEEMPLDQRLPRAFETGISDLLS